MSNWYPPQQPYYYPQPMPMYYPQQESGSGGRNWAAIIAGLAALGIGSYAVYWLWQNGYFGGKKGCKTSADCEAGQICKSGKCVQDVDCNTTADCPTGYICNAQKKCEPSTGCTTDANCPTGQHCNPATHLCVQCLNNTHCPTGFKCSSNNRCVPDIVACSQVAEDWPCHPGWTGLQRCDPNSLGYNLCRCDGSQWQLVERESSTCENNVKHNECFANSQHQSLCYWTYGEGEDTCAELDISRGCPCGQTTECVSTHCCPDNVCRDIADGVTSLYATCPSNSLTCWAEHVVTSTEDYWVKWAKYNFNSNGLTGFKHPIALNQINDLRVHIAGTQILYWSGFAYYEYNGVQALFGQSGLEDPCLLGCGSPLKLGNIRHDAGPVCMDALIVGIASPTGPPNITGIQCTFTL